MSAPGGGWFEVVPLVLPVPPRKEILGKLSECSGMCRGARRCLLCAHVPWLVMLWWRHGRNPQESALGQTETWQILTWQICDVVKHHLHWRKERDVERLGNLLKVTLPVAGRAGARIQSWLWALCLHHWAGFYSRELQLKWEMRDTEKVLDSWTDCKCSGQSCDYSPCELC